MQLPRTTLPSTQKILDKKANILYWLQLKVARKLQYFINISQEYLHFCSRANFWNHPGIWSSLLAAHKNRRASYSKKAADRLKGRFDKNQTNIQWFYATTKNYITKHSKNIRQKSQYSLLVTFESCEETSIFHQYFSRIPPFLLQSKFLESPWYMVFLTCSTYKNSSSLRQKGSRSIERQI